LMLSGHEVKADWLTGIHHEGGIGEPFDWAKQDFEDIDACTHFVLFNLPVEDPEPSTGRNIEFGYAYAKNKLTIVIGQSKSVFFELATMRFDTVEDFLDAVAPKTRLHT
jgi:nucleoside 2-deoxyribosyltransferase